METHSSLEENNITSSWLLHTSKIKNCLNDIREIAHLLYETSKDYNYAKRQVAIQIEKEKHWEKIIETYPDTIKSLKQDKEVLKRRLSLTSFFDKKQKVALKQEIDALDSEIMELTNKIPQSEELLKITKRHNTLFDLKQQENQHRTSFRNIALELYLKLQEYRQLRKEFNAICSENLPEINFSDIVTRTQTGFNVNFNTLPKPNIFLTEDTEVVSPYIELVKENLEQHN